jgi:A-kinase anchor protein 14
MDTKDNSEVQETEDESNMIDTEGNTNMTDPQDNKNVTEVALALVEATIAAAVQFVKGSNPVWLPKRIVSLFNITLSGNSQIHALFSESINPIKNIKWITHGEFTPERGRRQIEKFVSVS